MALTITTPNNRISTLIPGFGFEVAVNIVWDAEYPTGGETAALNTIFANEVYGGHVISDTVDDAGWVPRYVRDTAGAPATGDIQLYYANYDAADGVMIEVPDMTNVSAMDGQLWMFYGR